MNEFDEKNEVFIPKDPNMVAFRRAFERIDCESIILKNISSIKALKRRFDTNEQLEPELLVILLANVDDPKGRELAERLMPGKDELMDYLERNDTSILTTVIDRDSLQEFLNKNNEEASSEFMLLDKSVLQAVTVTDGKVAIYNVNNYIR